jgi:hypothetical protein
VSDPGELRRSVRDAILMHLRIHPDASDTASGIRDWWLRAAGCEEDPALVESVLDELVRGGIMKQRHLPDGGVLYSAARTNDR